MQKQERTKESKKARKSKERKNREKRGTPERRSMSTVDSNINERNSPETNYFLVLVMKIQDRGKKRKQKPGKRRDRTTNKRKKQKRNKPPSSNGVFIILRLSKEISIVGGSYPIIGSKELFPAGRAMDRSFSFKGDI
jgi:hypothetical protein